MIKTRQIQDQHADVSIFQKSEIPNMMTNPNVNMLGPKVKFYRQYVGKTCDMFVTCHMFVKFHPDTFQPF